MCKNLRNTVLVQFSKYIGAAVAGWGTGYLLTETLGRNIMAHGKRMEALAEEMRNHPERAKEIGAKLRAYASELEPLAKKNNPERARELGALDMAILRGLKRAEALVEGISNNPEKARQVEAIVSAAANEFEARRKK